METPAQFKHEYDLDSACTVTPRGRQFLMHVTPRFRFHYEGQAYEKFTSDLLASIAKRAALFVDVGAHYGYFSLLAGNSNPQLEIIAIEPTPETFTLLERNLAQLANAKVSLCRAAMGSTIGKKDLLFRRLRTIAPSILIRRRLRCEPLTSRRRRSTPC
jgi:hypothetical protein